jgi:hypothetical protein
MLTSIFDHARLTIDAGIAHYVGRLAIAIPVAVAFGFATGATYLLLSEEFGPVGACAILAGVYLVVAFIVAMIVVAYERNQRIMLHQAAQQSALMSGLMTAAPVALAGGGQIARSIGLKAPLLLGSALLVAALLGKATQDGSHPQQP